MLQELFGRIIPGNSYKKVSAQSIANQNGIEYISTTHLKKLSRGKQVNAYYAIDNKYILLHPPNDGYPTCPIEWYLSPMPNSRVPDMIIDNQSAFSEIQNMDKLLIQMVKLYEKYIDQDVFISWMGFVAKLDGIVFPNFQGKATLAVNEDFIVNNKVKPNELTKTKIYLVNDFLDHYIGWNFGREIAKNQYLEKVLLDFNELLISKGLREPAGPGFNVWASDSVQHYAFKLHN